VSDRTAADILLELGRAATTLPGDVITRVIFGLSHHAFDATAQRQALAREALVDMLNNPQLPEALRDRVLWTWRHSEYSPAQLNSLLDLLAPTTPGVSSGLLRLSARVVLERSAPLLARSLRSLDPRRMPWPNLLELARVALEAEPTPGAGPRSPLPHKVRCYFIDVAGQSGETGDEAFALLGSASDPATVMRWLTRLFLASPTRRAECLRQLAAAQRRLSRWAQHGWLKIVACVQNARDLERELIRALGATMRKEAALLLGALHPQLLEAHLREFCRDWLEQMKQAGVSEAGDALTLIGAGQEE
jgi:hypothetical protein